jgi:hypothetical protein
MPVNQYERAFRAWPLLTTRASEELKVTYSELTWLRVWRAELRACRQLARRSGAVGGLGCAGRSFTRRRLAGQGP